MEFLFFLKVLFLVRFHELDDFFVLSILRFVYKRDAFVSFQKSAIFYTLSS